MNENKTAFVTFNFLNEISSIRGFPSLDFCIDLIKKIESYGLEYLFIIIQYRNDKKSKTKSQTCNVFHKLESFESIKILFSILDQVYKKEIKNKKINKKIGYVFKNTDIEQLNETLKYIQSQKINYLLLTFKKEGQNVGADFSYFFNKNGFNKLIENIILNIKSIMLKNN